jgi:cytochrome oxidase assembly protein ShyY1
VYGFLATRRWIAFGAVAVLAAAVMVGLGLWQLSRYHQRIAANARIDAAARATPVPVDQVLRPGQPPAPGVAWTRVTLTGRYDRAHEILVRDRTVDGNIGFEILTPLVLADGSAVLVDRGWLSVARNSVLTPVPVPAAPDGTVTVIGRVHLPESHSDAPRQVNGHTQVRRISPARLTGAVPYPLYGGYVLLDDQQPTADQAFAAIPSDHQNSVMNAGYVVQWWAFALITAVGFIWAVRREARGPDDFDLAQLEDGLTEAPVSPAL